MKKLPLSKFDLIMIGIFVVIGLLGGGAWYYLSQQLTQAQQDVTAAKSEFDRYSSYHASAQEILVSHPNQKILQNNIDILKGELVPLIQDKLMAKDNKLPSIVAKDPVAWKHDLDDEVRRLTNAANVQSVKLPPNFYFAFSNYLNQNPADDQTVVLSKQLLAIEQITTILTNAPVRSILDLHRTMEEDSRSGGGGSSAGGASYEAPGGAYHGYPFEIEFESSSAGLRKVLNDLIRSPYVFVVRSLAVENEQGTSPLPGDLERMAGSTDNSVTDKPPGEAAATVSTKGPQYLFGNSTLHVKMRVDLIDWSTPPPN
jgi:hypothetical protein